MKNITVYCGSGLGNNPLYAEHAEQLGKEIALNGANLVYGGGFKGLMGKIANAVLENGGKITGVTVKEFWDNEKRSVEEKIKQFPNYNIKIEIASNLAERREILYKYGDVLCVLPGSIGTIDELSEVLVVSAYGKLNKDIIILNSNGYYNDFLKQIEKSVTEGFVSADLLKSIKIVSNPKDVMIMINKEENVSIKQCLLLKEYSNRNY